MNWRTQLCPLREGRGADQQEALLAWHILVYSMVMVGPGPQKRPQTMAPSLLEITLYTKENCSLCLKAKRVLRESQRRHGFRLVEVDITSDPDLYERHKYDIPVVTLNGREIFRHRVDAQALAAVLEERKKSV